MIETETKTKIGITDIVMIISIIISIMTRGMTMRRRIGTRSIRSILIRISILTIGNWCYGAAQSPVLEVVDRQVTCRHSHVQALVIGSEACICE